MRFFPILLALVLAASCRGEDPLPPIEPVGRVVIAYLCADNDLSSEVAVKLDALGEGMRRAGDVDGRLVVYADCRDALPCLKEVTARGIKDIATFAEMNSASPQGMKRVLQRIVNDFPAERYGLICFSHASGWLPEGALNDPAGFDAALPATQAASRTIFDDGGDEMPLADFAAALDVLPGGEKFDFLLFETCYMAGVEVAYELRDRTNYIVASSAEMLSDGFAEVFPSSLGSLFSAEADLRTFARNHFDIWNAKSGAWRSATISVINTAHIGALTRAVDAITAGRCDWAAGIDLASLQHFNRNPHHLFFDLGQAMEKAASPAQFVTFNEALSLVVEYKAATPRFVAGSANSFSITRHSGLTTYMMQDAFPQLNAAYVHTAWFGALFPEE